MGTFYVIGAVTMEVCLGMAPRIIVLYVGIGVARVCAHTESAILIVLQCSDLANIQRISASGVSACVQEFQVIARSQTFSWNEFSFFFPAANRRYLVDPLVQYINPAVARFAC